MVQEFWRKLNANERMVSWGAVALLVLSLFGGGWLSLVGGAAVLIIYYLQYAPNQSVRWPAPVPTMILAIAAVLAISAALGTLAALGFASLGFGIGYGFGFGLFGGIFLLYVLVAIASLVAAGAMVLGAWREYQKGTAKS